MQHDIAHEEKQNKALRALAHEIEALGARGVLARVEEILGADEAAPSESEPEAASKPKGPMYAPPEGG